MARRRTPHRILLNLALDSVLAALALPMAVMLAAARWPGEAWWYGALPGAMAALLLAGLTVRMPQQYWRYAGLPDLLGVAVAAVGGAALFWGGLLALGAERPANLAFPVIHALALAVLLGLPRVAARIHHARRGAPGRLPGGRHPVDALPPIGAAHPRPPHPRHGGRDRAGARKDARGRA